MSAHDLLNLLNELEKSAFYLFFRNKFDKFNNV